MADKAHPEQGQRKDASRYLRDGMLRVPASYLLKLSMADAFDNAALPGELKKTAARQLQNLLSDNTSPEILSFSIGRTGKHSAGYLAAAETARTLLLSQLLVQYANRKFRLLENGQKVHLYFAPLAPIRQKLLNELVPDGYYRHLFMSPCLSGWDRGEEKHEYMGICHKTLSRSQLNSIGKLKDAGILVNNLITLPNTSNTCLANNGTHVSIGSQILSEMAGKKESLFTPAVEKYTGDLAIKIIEHFLPLFVGTYSAAPYRIDFKDFHPEKVLGFLPHELDYTHLRMTWRRWKRKAKISFLGNAFTPFGPRWLDALLARLLGLRGDLVPDFRLIDYLVCLLSTESSPALDGTIGNHDRLKNELMEMGVFDSRMSMYLLFRQRLLAVSGYCGFEGRSYSLFPSFKKEMRDAIDLQNLLLAVAYKAIIEERITHADIPDQPTTESERRQIFFGCAIDIPTFYVRADSGNQFLMNLLMKIPTLRRSRRYRGYLRVKNNDYRLALLQFLREEYSSLIEEMKMIKVLKCLEDRLMGKELTAGRKIVAGVVREAGAKAGPLRMDSCDFNGAAENYYRNTVKKDHLREGLQVLLEDCRQLEAHRMVKKQEGFQLPDGESYGSYLQRHGEAIVEERAESGELRNVMCLWLTVVDAKTKKEL